MKLPERLPVWSQSFPWDLIIKCAERHALEPLVVAALIMVESSGQTFATRYEKGYRWLSNPERHARELGLTFDTEVIAQSHSYGLMQIMGATARSFGFTGYCVELVEPVHGLEFGCRYLARCFTRWPELDKALAAYNAGSPRDVAPADGILDNQQYVDKVLRRLAEFKDGKKPVA